METQERLGEGRGAAPDADPQGRECPAAALPSGRLPGRAVGTTLVPGLL